MSGINGVGGNGSSYQPSLDEKIREKDIDLEDISILYTTSQQEEYRSTFDDTFGETSLNEAADGAKYLQSLIDNKAELAADLGLDEEQYDELACIALALASQETGMGFEDGYVSENTGFGLGWRKFSKWAHVTFFGGESASSGLTQMKIYDFMNTDKLTQEQKDIIAKYGISAKGIATNNLYSEPDKAAIATMVVLKSLADKYPEYLDKLATEHSNIVFNDNLTDEQRIQKGDEILADISAIYENADDDTKVQIRSKLKRWLESLPDEKDKNWNEAEQLKILNGYLASGNPPMTLEQSDLNYIRYTLSAPNKEMTKTEFCAYTWLNEISYAMKFDRMLSEKIGTILSNPEDLDYDQYSVNVSTLAEMYKNQSVD